jgi:hypothetical protein
LPLNTRETVAMEAPETRLTSYSVGCASRGGRIEVRVWLIRFGKTGLENAFILAPFR